MLKRGEISAKFFVYILFLIIIGLTSTTAQLGQLGVPSQGVGVGCPQLTPPLQREGCTYTPKYDNNRCVVGYDERCLPCPQLSPPAPEWCINGKIIPSGVDENGCQLPPKCEKISCSQLSPEECLKYDNCQLVESRKQRQRCVEKPICPIPECAAPPAGCSYEGGRDEKGCPTCGKLVCEKPICGNNICEVGECKEREKCRYPCPQDCQKKCAQENYGNPDFCKGLSEGDTVTSCDCNKCGCIKGSDGKLYPSCTEMACPQQKCPPPPPCSVPLIYGDPNPGDSNQCPVYTCPSPVCGNNICEKGEDEIIGQTNSIPPSYIIKCPQDCQKKEIEVKVPSSFSLSESQTARVVNYQDMRIRLNRIIITTSGGTCKEFEDRSKNYIIGEIIVGFKPDVTLQQAKEVVESLGVSIKKVDQVIFNDLHFLLISVPPDQEKIFINNFSSSSFVRYAELNGCGAMLLGTEAAPPPPFAKITVLSPGGCGPNADPRCLGPPGFSKDYTIFEGETIDVQGLKITFSGVARGNVLANFEISTKPACGNNICEESEANYCPPCVNANPPCKVACKVGTCPQDCQQKCAPENEFCGGIAGITCCSGLTCKLAGSYPDAGGICVTKGVCPAIYKPVCGVDGNTYGNSCEAETAGVKIVCEGQCPCKSVCGNNICEKGEDEIIGQTNSIPPSYIIKCPQDCQPKEQGFIYAKWQCYDGYAESQGNETSCESPETWLSYARESCKRRCKLAFKSLSKCGINSFSVSVGC